MHRVYLFCSPKSTGCCWGNILNQPAVSQPAGSSSLAPAVSVRLCPRRFSSLSDRLTEGDEGVCVCVCVLPSLTATFNFNSLGLTQLELTVGHGYLVLPPVEVINLLTKEDRWSSTACWLKRQQHKHLSAVYAIDFSLLLLLLFPLPNTTLRGWEVFSRFLLPALANHLSTYGRVLLARLAFRGAALLVGQVVAFCCGGKRGERPLFVGPPPPFCSGGAELLL